MEGVVARQAWGLAQDGPAWVLLGLTRQSADLCCVHTLNVLVPPQGISVIHASWLSQALVNAPRPKFGPRYRLAMSVPAHALAAGQMACPLDVPQQAWPSEVQLEVAQALSLPPEEVSFDFESEASGAGMAGQIRWVGCARSLVADYQNWIAAVQGWRLALVEPEMDAARRGAQALVGGLPSLLQQAPQDWQFRWGSKVLPDLDGSSRDDVHWDGVLQEVLSAPVGARLVASGLALKAWA
ncbi:hypothetical protein B9Z52_05525 [Limnohabitans sp. Jir72]|nr:hypothetical protein B9Z52_05525 [Limnohabitans sp. Jir72]